VVDGKKSASERYLAAGGLVKDISLNCTEAGTHVKDTHTHTERERERERER